MSNTGTYDSDDHFPVDWNQWHPQWNRWLAEHVDDLTRSSKLSSTTSSSITPTTGAERSTLPTRPRSCTP